MQSRGAVELWDVQALGANALKEPMSQKRVQSAAGLAVQDSSLAVLTQGPLRHG